MRPSGTAISELVTKSAFINMLILLWFRARFAMKCICYVFDPLDKIPGCGVIQDYVDRNHVTLTCMFVFVSVIQCHNVVAVELL